MANVLIRVWLPDRPGALGAVASRIGSIRGDIVGLDVLERGDGIAVDEFAVELEHDEVLPMLVREIEEVD
ncbi:MAG TPA: amino acid-binding protein, partial [Acidimicrobiia bacterium]|nr:amino acid-binding protein [Acidimicrobiia bacterium]